MANISSGPIECDRSGRSYSVRGSEVDLFGDFSVAVLTSAVGSYTKSKSASSKRQRERENLQIGVGLTLRCCDEPISRDSRLEGPVISCEPPPFFLLARPKSLLSADLNVDFFRCGPSLLCPVWPLAESLMSEYRARLIGGLVALASGVVLDLKGDDLCGEACFGDVFRGGDRETGR